MQLHYKVEKGKSTVTLTLKDSQENRTILYYMRHELSLQNELYSMNERPLFLKSCTESSNDEHSILTINYLNGNEGLMDITGVFFKYFNMDLESRLLTGVFFKYFNMDIEDRLSSSTVEGDAEFEIVYKDRFRAITSSGIPDKDTVSTSSSSVGSITTAAPSSPCPPTSSSSSSKEASIMSKTASITPVPASQEGLPAPLLFLKKSGWSEDPRSKSHMGNGAVTEHKSTLRRSYFSFE